MTTFPLAWRTRGALGCALALATPHCGARSALFDEPVSDASSFDAPTDARSKPPSDATPRDGAPAPQADAADLDSQGAVPGVDASRVDAVALDASADAPSTPDAPSDAGKPGPACYLGAPFVTPSWRPPTPLHQGACTTAELATYFACLGAATCSSGGPTCDACLVSDVTSEAYGPVLTSTSSGATTFVGVNFGGCEADVLRDPSPAGCGAQENDAVDCLTFECSTCADFDSSNPAPNGFTNQCLDTALAFACASQETAACSANWAPGTPVATTCGDATGRGVLSAWCGP